MKLVAAAVRRLWRPAACAVAMTGAGLSTAAAPVELTNARYRVMVAEDGTVRVHMGDVPEQVIVPEYTVMCSPRDPGYDSNHLNYLLAPRTAIRWANFEVETGALNRWLQSPEVRMRTGGATGTVTTGVGGARTWAYRDPHGQIVQRITGPYARGTTDPFAAGARVVLRARATSVDGRTVHWAFPSDARFSLHAELTLPAGDADPQLTHGFTAYTEGYYSVAFTGMPAIPVDAMLPVPQEAAGRGLRQFGHLVCEGELKLPRVQMAARGWNAALVIDAAEAPFRIPTRENSRFGVMLWLEGGLVRPVCFAPILGGAESHLSAGESRTFSTYWLLRPGDWKQTYRDIARTYYGYRDQRDNTGPGSLNGALERTMDYLADRNGHNYAMWHEEQKYYDYWTDNSGIFKPFSPLFGLSAAVVTDDLDFYVRRARPQVEFALSRRSNVFAPYEVENNGQVGARNRGLGESYLAPAQLVSLGAFFQGRTPAILAQVEQRGLARTRLPDLLACFALSGAAADLDAAREVADATLRKGAGPTGDEYMDYLDLYDVTRESRYLQAAVEGAYGVTTTLNLSPAVPDALMTFDVGGTVPIHAHSRGRHPRWGFPQPQPFPAPQLTVPAWRVALTGLESPAYRGEFWMNNHGQLMRLAGLAHDDFLRDVARWGMVGRFGMYAGDNRSNYSLVTELPDAVEHPIWQLDYATVNPGHAWEFVGELLDFLISDAFARSDGRIDFPARSMPGASFRVRVYGDRTGRFYDDDGVRLWLPRRLLTADNRQVDYLAGYGSGRLYLAFWNQAFTAQSVTVRLSPERVRAAGERRARVWRNNAGPEAATIYDGRLSFPIPAKGIVAYAIDDVTVRTTLQARMLDPSVAALGSRSFTEAEASFGKVHAMLLSLGRGLTTAYVYTDALPENVITATLHYRQGKGPWHEQHDAIFPYEFTAEFKDGGGDLEAVFEVENARQEIQCAAPVILSP